MNKDFESILKAFADHLIKIMGENRAMHFMSKFIQIEPGSALKSMVDALVLYACKEYGINKETFFYSTKMIHCYARITCFHLVKKHINLSSSQIAKLFQKKKKDSVLDGVEKAQGMLDIPQFNPDFVSRYKSIEKHYLNFTTSISDERGTEN